MWFCMRFVADDLPNDFCTRAEGKERATRLDGYQRDRDAMVALHSRGYNVTLYLSYLYDLAGVLFRRAFILN